ncbi:hypothetical protein ACQPZJ_17840 [Actinoplanes sp. CA-054009]
MPKFRVLASVKPALRRLAATRCPAPRLGLGVAAPRLGLGVAAPRLGLRVAAPRLGLRVAAPRFGLRVAAPRIALAGVVASAVLVGGCGGGDDEVAPWASAEATAGMVAADEAGDDAGLAAQRVGVAFRYRELFSDETPAVDWAVTVTGVKCGITIFPDAADNPDYTSGDWSSDDVPPEHVDARPASGWEYCRMDATMKNVGRTPASGTEEFGHLVTDRGEYAFSGLDETIAANLQRAEDFPVGPYNPGMTARLIRVWTVPTGTRAEAVLFPQDSLFDHPAHRISLA